MINITLMIRFGALGGPVIGKEEGAEVVSLIKQSLILGFLLL